MKGARQVDKIWLMKEFGERYFKKTAYINFDNNQRMKEVFDEIQEAPSATADLKYFYENASEYAVRQQEGRCRKQKKSQNTITPY